MLNKQDLSIAIGELSEVHWIELGEHIDSYLNMTDIKLPSEVQAAIHAASKEAYFMALKTIEEAIISCLSD